MTFTISAGLHDRYDNPIWVKLTEEQAQGLPVKLLLIDGASGAPFPAQNVRCDGVDYVVFVLPYLKAGETLNLCLRPSEAKDDGIPITGSVDVDNGLDQIDFSLDGRLFTSYVYSDRFAKPFWGPIYRPDTHLPITRLDLEVKEHPHQRSLWFSHGNVNGVDGWNEKASKHGRQLHQEILWAQGGAVIGWMGARNVWTDFDRNPLVDECRTFALYRTGGGILVDLTLKLTAAHGEVVLGPTKEAGPLGIRVAPTMAGTEGGRITNTSGAIGGTECWGRRAPWCDYAGVVAGRLVGIAAFDHPENVDHPTHWHVRDYGLMAPNNFHWCGERRISGGESLSFKYRLLIHEGDALQASVAGRWLDYAYPCSVDVS